jgi:ferric-dicitrate binding protein FerR (iron transport regulator)
MRLAAALVAHEAAWELASETYAVSKSRQRYRRLHREHPNPLRRVFWVGMAGLALVGTVICVWKPSQRQGSQYAAKGPDDEQSV